MRTTSADYKSAIYATERECRGYIKFNNDSTKLIRGVDGLVSITLHEQLADEERPMFGGAVSRYVEVEFFNSGLPAGVSLANSYIDTYMGVVTKDTGTAPVGSIENDTATVEYIWNGRFYISEIDRSKLSTKVVAYDEFSKLNKQYVPTVVKGGSGYSVDDIAEDVLTQAGFVSHSVSLTGYVDELYEGTCRQMLSWVWGTNSLGCNLKMSRTAPTSITAITLDGAWSDKDNAENAVTDNEIYLGGLGDGDPFTVSSVTTGTENNPITAGSGTGLVGENPYLTSANASTILTNVGGITFKPMTIEFRGNPAIDTGDVLKVTSDGNTAYCYVQKMTTTFNGGIKQTIECYGDSEFYYTTEFNPTATHIKAAVSNMAQEIQHDIETADNGVITKILDADGSWKELVIANNQDLDSATSVWRWNINGLAHSTSYSGGTYNFAVDMNGRIIANVIQTGILQDALGKNSWNLDTGAFNITNGSIHITTAADDTDSIILRYGDWQTWFSPSAIYNEYVDSSTTKKSISLNGQAISGYWGPTTARIPGFMLGSMGTLTLGGYNSTAAQGNPGYITVKSGTSGSGSTTFEVDGSTGTISSYNSARTDRVNLNSGGLRFFNIANNYTLSAYSPTATYLRNSTGTTRISLDGESGEINLSNPNVSGSGIGIFSSLCAISLENGSQRLYLTPKIDNPAIRLDNASSGNAYSFLVWPDANGAGRIILGAGTGTIWRTTLDNTGLTFRNSSDAVTYSYPATGLWTKDVPSANMVDWHTFTRSTISATGVISDSTTRLLSPLIPVKQSTQYMMRTYNASRYIYEVHEYGSSWNWIRYASYNGHTAYHTTSSDCYFIRILARNNDNSTITPSNIPNILMREIAQGWYDTFTPYQTHEAEITDKFAFADWYIPVINSTNITDKLNAQNTALPNKRTVFVRIWGDSGGNQVLIVQKASDNYGAAFTVGYYSKWRFLLSGGTWSVESKYDGESASVSWYQGRAYSVFRNRTIPATTSQYIPALDLLTVDGDWAIGTLGNHLYFVHTKDAKYSSSTNETAKYYLAASTSNFTYRILDESIGALKPTHISGSTTKSATTSWAYSGVSFTVPASKYFVVTAHAYYSAVSPAAVGISDSSSAVNSGHMQIEGNVDSQNTRARCTWSGYLSAQTTYYVWVKGASSGNVGVGVDGFYFS